MKRFFSFLTGLFTFALGAAILWLSVGAMQIDAFAFVGFLGFLLGWLLLFVGGGMAIGR